MAGPDGHARVQGLVPGDYRIYAWDDTSKVEYANPAWMQRYGTNVISVSVSASQTAHAVVKEQIATAQ